jgi:riboflavin synthase alpha subunit
VFTGIVREVGTVIRSDGGADGRRLEIEAPETAAGVGIGSSVAIDGACLTAEAVTEGRMVFHAVPETLSRTTIGGLSAGAAVNVEPALRAGEPLGGHLVQGHVDGTGTVQEVASEGDGVRVHVAAAQDVLRYCVVKGSITVAGVSLTVVALSPAAFAVALVPHTLSATTLGSVEPGTAMNLEVDVLAKYVERLLAGR